MIDTARSLHIPGSRRKLAGLAGLGIVMTGASALVALQNGAGLIVGGIGVLFFGACLGVALRRLARAGEPVVTLSPEGVLDRRVTREIVPWEAVRDITTWHGHGQRIMVLAIDPAVEGRLAPTAVARWTRGGNRLLGADGLCITASDLRIGYDALLEATLAYARAARCRKPGPH